MRRPWPRQLAAEAAVGIPLCVFIGAFITLVNEDLTLPLAGRRLALNIGYSLCIGLLIQSLIEGGRFALSRWKLARWPDDAAARHDWPGWGLMTPWTLVSAATGYLSGTALADALFDGNHLAAVLGGRLQPVALLFVIALLASFITVTFFNARGRLAASEAAARRAEQLATEHRLRLLESQLEPHMLFNTLANLRVLIALDPPRAQAMLDRLIAFLRATLAASRRGRHALADEFARIEDYLELMKVRMGPRLETICDLPPELAALPTPPLLLQPLVENAIRHGLEPRVAGGRIVVSARREGDELVLVVRDTGVGLAAPAPPGLAEGDDPTDQGFGLSQVTDRLAALYGTRASLVLAAAGDADGGTVAMVRMPIETAAPAAADERTTSHSDRLRAGHGSAAVHPSGGTP